MKNIDHQPYALVCPLVNKYKNGYKYRFVFLSALFLSSLLLCNAVRAQPTISSLSAGSGIPGSSVTITGTNFNTTPANDIVYFGATRATVNTASSTSLSVTVPVGATYAPVTVNNTATNLMASSPYAFMPVYDNSTHIGAPLNFDLGMPDTVGVMPRTIVISDIDGDGKPDLVVTDVGNFTVSVLRNISSGGLLSTGSFAAPVIIATGRTHYIAVVGDIDGDGKPDLAVTNSAEESVSVLRNMSTPGTISFAPEVIFAGGSGYQEGLAIGDIDGDGKPELVLANTSDASISVLRNTSSPGSITASSFAAQVTFPVGGQPWNVVISDIDGDGKPDVVATTFESVVSVLRNTSSIASLSFDAGVTFAAGGIDYGTVAVGDIDGDNKPDMAVVNNDDNTISIFRNTSSAGSISFTSQMVIAAGNNPWEIALSDIDGDSKPDLSVTNMVDNTFSVFHNTSSVGSISFASQVAFATDKTFDYPIGLAVGDLNGDGTPDIAVANNGVGTLSLFTNNPLYPPPTITSVSPNTAIPGASVTITGTNFNATSTNDFVYFGATRATVTAATNTSLTVTVPSGATYMPVTVNNDSGATAYEGLSFVPVFNNSTYLADSIYFDPKVDFNNGGSTPYATIIEDIDGDGKPDMVVCDLYVGAISVFRNISSGGSINAGSFAAPVTFATAIGATKMLVGDMDGDGKPDLVIFDRFFGGFSVFRNTSTSGSVSFADEFILPDPYGLEDIAIGDIDGDGRPEIVVTGYIYHQYLVGVLRNTSSPGSLSFSPPVGFSTGAYPVGITIGDIDGDGKKDMAVESGTGVAVLLNTSSVSHISFATATTFPSYDTTGTSYSNSVITMGDVDGDGKQDLLVLSYHVSVFRNTSSIGAASFTTGTPFGTFINPNVEALGDIDGDGKPDLAVADFGNNKVSVFRNTSTSGTVSYATQKTYVTGNNPYAVALGDLDGDGKPEMIVTNANDNTVSVFQNNPLRQLPVPPTITSVSPNPAIPGTAVTITGTNFNTTPANDIVYFGATQATVNTASATSLNVTLPVGATYAPVSVDNTALSLEAFSQYNFLPTYNNSGYLPDTVNFDPQVAFATGGDNPGNIVIGDIDGDGKPDMIVINNAGGYAVSVFRNTSASGSITAGSFAAPATFAIIKL